MAVSNLQIIEELCVICEMQNGIIKAQSEALTHLGAATMEGAMLALMGGAE